MMYMPDCLRATWELLCAPRERLRRTTYNLTAMSFTPAQLEASISSNCGTFEVRVAPPSVQRKVSAALLRHFEPSSWRQICRICACRIAKLLAWYDWSRHAQQSRLALN